MRSALVLAAALALAACTREAPAAGTETPGALTLTAQGAGRLGAATPFDTASVRDALPAGFTTEMHDGQSGAPEIWALRDGQIVFEVTASSAGSVATVGRIGAPNAAVAGPRGIRPGQTFAEAGGADLDCAPGTGALQDLAVCPDAGVDLVFASQALVGRTEMPPVDSLGDAFLERLVWRADRQESPEDDF